MSETVAKITATKVVVKKVPRVRPKEAQDTKSEGSYYARRYLEVQTANTNARVQSEIDEVTHRIIIVEQQLLAAQDASEDITSLEGELATLQSERKAKKEHLVFRPMGKSYRKG